MVLVDVTPEALLERLRAGNVYPEARIDAALNGFFRIENLTALREAALRQVAEDVVSKQQVVSPAPAVGERLLALVQPEPSAQRLVRRAWRSAQRLGADSTCCGSSRRVDLTTGLRHCASSRPYSARSCWCASQTMSSPRPWRRSASAAPPTCCGRRTWPRLRPLVGAAGVLDRELVQAEGRAQRVELGLGGLEQLEPDEAAAAAAEARRPWPGSATSPAGELRGVVGAVDEHGESVWCDQRPVGIQIP